jgi:hypothetical protein
MRREWDGVRDCITPGNRKWRSLSIIGIASAVILPDTRSSHKTRLAREAKHLSAVERACIRCRYEGIMLCFGDSESTRRQRVLMKNGDSQLETESISNEDPSSPGAECPTQVRKFGKAHVAYEFLGVR